MHNENERAKMYQFEDVLEQFEPMISAAIRKCRIYKNHEHFRQTARIGLWQAWQRYNHQQGDFAPYAYKCIYGSILDELKREHRYEERYQPEQDEIIEYFIPPSLESEVSYILDGLLSKLTKEEQQFLIDYYIVGYRYEELSVKYGASIAALKKRKTRILQRLRKQL